MPTIKIDVPPGATVKVYPRGGFFRALGAAIGEVSEEHRHEREERQLARYRNTFAVGDLVMRTTHGHTVHAVVRHVGKPGPNEPISVHFAGCHAGSGSSPWVLACRWRHATLFSRLNCDRMCCKAWKALPLWSRLRRAHELVEN